MNKRICLAIVFSIFCWFGSVNLYSQDRIHVSVAGDEQIHVLMQARFYKDIDFVPVRELADLFEAKTFYNNLNKKMILYLGNHRIKVTAYNPFIMIDDTVLQMPITTDFDGDKIWVPLDYFIELIAPYSPSPISYDRNTHTLSLVKEGVNIFAVNIEEKINGTLIRIATLRKFDLNSLARRISQGWLYIDIYGGRIDSTKIMNTKPSGIVRKMIPIQFEESAQLSFHLKKAIEKEDIFVSSNDNEIIVSLRTSKKIPENMIVDLEQERKKWIIDKIVIDPGHGGKDPGAIGYKNLKEKDVVLAIAKRLKKIIEQRLNVQVLMTRDSDKSVDLRERSAFANRHGGKLFISIHANSLRTRNVRGTEILVLGAAKTERDLELALKENSVIRYEESWAEYGDLTDENYILMAMAQNSYNKESQELAEFVQNEISKALNTKNRGLSQGPYIVLIGTSMPKILVEVGFISNPQESNKLRDKSYQQKVADGIYKGIKKFKEYSEKAVVNGLTTNQQYH